MTRSRQVEIDFAPVGKQERRAVCAGQAATLSQGRRTEMAERPDTVVLHWKRIEIGVRIKRTTSPTSIDFKCARKLSSQSVVAVKFG